MILRVDHIDVAYGSESVLHDVSFEVKAGELLSILGPNGVGKTTLFRCILNLMKPLKGTISLDGKDILHITPRELTRCIAHIPQSHAPAFDYSVLDMVLMGTASHMGLLQSPGKVEEEVARRALARLSIEHLADRSYRQCSGGEQQLCLVARALTQQAHILVMDEPSSSLDFGNRIKVMQMVKGLTAEGYTVIQTTHDPEQAYVYSDKILALHEGSVLAWGTPQEVIQSPLMSKLYGVSVEVATLQDDHVRICVPTRSLEAEPLKSTNR